MARHNPAPPVQSTAEKQAWLKKLRPEELDTCAIDCTCRVCKSIVKLKKICGREMPRAEARELVLQVLYLADTIATHIEILPIDEDEEKNIADDLDSKLYDLPPIR